MSGAYFEENGVWWTYDSLGAISTDTPINDALAELHRLQDKTKADGWAAVRLQIVDDYGSPQVGVFGRRRLTDGEERERIRSAVDIGKYQERIDRATLKRLQEKYGKES